MRINVALCGVFLFAADFYTQKSAKMPNNYRYGKKYVLFPSFVLCFTSICDKM